MIERASNTNALTLSARKANTAFAYNGFKTSGKRADKLFELCGANSAGNGSIINFVVGKAKRNIAPQRIVGQINGLRYIANLILPSAQILLDIAVANKNCSSAWRE